LAADFRFVTEHGANDQVAPTSIAAADGTILADGS
jgi:hypothetical protein